MEGFKCMKWFLNRNAGYIHNMQNKTGEDMPKKKE